MFTITLTIGDLAINLSKLVLIFRESGQVHRTSGKDSLMSSSLAGDKIARFLSLQPSRFKHLERLRAEKHLDEDGKVSCDVEVLLSNEFTTQSRRLRLKFIRSTDVKFGDFNVTFACMVVIRDISDRQLEDLTYRASEEEVGYFSLNCQDFEFEEVEKGLLS